MLFHLFDSLNQVITGDEPFEVFLGDPGIEKFEHLLAVLPIAPLGSEDIKTTDNTGCAVFQFKLCLTEICTILIKEFEAGSVSVIADMTVLEVVCMLDALFPDLHFLAVYLVPAGGNYNHKENDCKKEDQKKVKNYISVHS